MSSRGSSHTPMRTTAAANKRKRASEPVSVGKRTRSARHTEDDDEASPAPRRAPRSRVGSSAVDSERRGSPAARPMARRSGGPLPGQRTAPASALKRGSSGQNGLPPPVVVEVPTRPRRLRLPTQSEGEDDDDVDAGEDDDEDDVVVSEKPPSRSTRNSRRSNATQDDTREAEASANAGPGPRTTRNRATRALGPVPQLSQSTFRPFLKGDRSRSSERHGLSKRKATGATQATQESESLGPRRKEMMDGEEVYVLSDGDEYSTSPEGFPCTYAACSATFDTTSQLERHKQSPHAAPRRTVIPLSTPRASTSAAETALLQEQVSRLEAKLEESKKKLVAQAITERRLKASTQKAEAAEAECTTLRASLDASEKGETAAKDTAATLDLQIADLKEQVATLGRQVKDRDSTITALQSKISGIEASEAELDQLVAQSQQTEDGQPPAPEVQIKLYKKRWKQTNSALRNTQADLDFVRAQYQMASTTAVEEVARSKQLDEQIVRLKEQLTVGLKQRELHNAAVTKQTKDKNSLRERQFQLLLDQSRRTDDTIRRKAAAHGRLVKDNRDLEAELHKARSKADELTKRNTDLADQVAKFRGMVMGAFEVESDDETDDDVPAPPAVLPVLVPNVTTEVKPSPTPQLDNAMLADGGIEAFKCKWIDDDVQCAELFQTREELGAHGLAHIQRLVLVGDMSM